MSAPAQVIYPRLDTVMMPVHAISAHGFRCGICVSHGVQTDIALPLGQTAGECAFRHAFYIEPLADGSLYAVFRKQAR